MKIEYFKISLKWFITKTFLSFPSKHVKRTFLNLFSDVNVHKSVPIYSGFEWWKGKFEVGEGSSIGFHNHIDCRRGVSIGKNVDLATGVCIWTLHHDYNSPDFKAVGGPVRIGDYSWLCSHCTILPGVTIGEGAVIAAGAVVTKDVEPWSIMGGIPAKKIGERKKQIYTYKPSEFWIPFF